MCIAPSAPAMTINQPIAPTATPQPMALPEVAKGGSVSQLRIGSKSNLKLQSAIGAAPSGLTVSASPK